MEAGEDFAGGAALFEDAPGVDVDDGEEEYGESDVVEGVAAEPALEHDGEGGGEGDERRDDVTDLHGVGDEAAEEVSEEGEQGHGGERDPGVGMLRGGTALEALVAGIREGENQDDHDRCGEFLQRDGPGGVAEKELAIALADVVDVDAGDVVVLAVDHERALEGKDEGDGGEAQREGGEDAEVETLADEDAGELAERDGDEDEDAEVVAGDGERDGESEAGEREDAGAGDGVVLCCCLPAEECEGVEAEEQAVGTAFDGVAKAGGEQRSGGRDDGGAGAGDAADEEVEAELEEEKTGERGEAQGDGVAAKEVHAEVREQMVGGRVERDGVAELDEDDLPEGGDAVGVEGEELVVPHEACVRPEEREGRGEEKKDGEKKVGARRLI